MCTLWLHAINAWLNELHIINYQLNEGQTHQSAYLSQHQSSADKAPGGHPIKTCSVETVSLCSDRWEHVTPGPLVPTEVHKILAIQRLRAELF